MNKSSYGTVAITVALVVGMGILLAFFSYKNTPIDQNYCIQTIDSFDQASFILQHLDSSTLVLFDVDDVLIKPPKGLEHGGLRLWDYIRLCFHDPSLLVPHNIELYQSKLFLHAQYSLIEPHVAQFIKQLQQSCTVLGLTSVESGPYGIIPDMPTWRSTVLSSLGIHFSTQYPATTFKQLKQYRDHYPVLYDGILCANQQPKGDVLGAFLDTYALHPSCVIFFDDGYDNLVSVGQCCKQRNINHRLFRYTGADKDLMHSSIYSTNFDNAGNNSCASPMRSMSSWPR